MTQDELLKWRDIFQSMILLELTVRNTVLFETLQARIGGQPGATTADGVQRTVSLLEDMKKRNRKIFQGHLEAQMLADEWDECIATVQQHAKGFEQSQ